MLCLIRIGWQIPCEVGWEIYRHEKEKKSSSLQSLAGPSHLRSSWHLSLPHCRHLTRNPISSKSQVLNPSASPVPSGFILSDCNSIQGFFRGVTYQREGAWTCSLFYLSPSSQIMTLRLSYLRINAQAIGSDLFPLAQSSIIPFKLV